MFTVERFVEECRTAVREAMAEAAVKEVVARWMASPREVERALGTPTRGGITTLEHSPELTVLQVVWDPGMTIYPHDHRMWAVIGLYGGREDNVFYRRSPEGLQQAGGKQLVIRDAALLGKTIIHSVTNPLRQLTAALHVYGGDFFATPRSEWDPQTLEERPYNVEHARRAFQEAHERWLAESRETGAR
jgi:predicted metal-dependent enzyme (double-stranded beta helix superfamily)